MTTAVEKVEHWDTQAGTYKIRVSCPEHGPITGIHYLELGEQARVFCEREGCHFMTELCRSTVGYLGKSCARECGHPGMHTSASGTNWTDRGESGAQRIIDPPKDSHHEAMMFADRRAAVALQLSVRRTPVGRAVEAFALQYGVAPHDLWQLSLEQFVALAECRRAFAEEDRNERLMAPTIPPPAPEEDPIAEYLG